MIYETYLLLLPVRLVCRAGENEGEREMILGFTQQINGKPTRFVEKIWAGLEKIIPNYLKTAMDYDYAYRNRFDLDLYPTFLTEKFQPKLHTIRRGIRWRADMDIHFAINTRTEEYFQFAPVVKCVSVQEIEITPEIRLIEIDGRVLGFSEVEGMAFNDGFESIEDFFGYFDHDFTGQIVHWTELKY